MKKILGIFFLILFCYDAVLAIELSDYSKEEQKQYKEIKKMKKDGVSGKDWINKKYWIKDKKNSNII